MNKPKSERNDSVLRIPLVRRQWVSLLTGINAPRDLMKRIQFAEVVGDHFEMSLKKDQWEELIGCIEVEADRVKRPRIQKELRELSNYIIQFLPRNVIDMNVYRNQHRGLNQIKDSSNQGPIPISCENNYSEDDDVFSSIEFDRPLLPTGLEETLLMSLDPHAWVANSEISGLTFDQLIQLIDSDWDNDLGTIRFNKSIELKDLKDSSILENTRIVLNEVASFDGVKATVTGRFNRKFISHILTKIKLEHDFLGDPHFLKRAINELDVFTVHIIRIILNMSRLIALKKGAMFVTKKGENLLKDDKAGQLFHLLFTTFFRRFNLGYIDQLAEILGLQETVSYSLYMLSNMDTKWRTEDELTGFLLLPPVMLEMKQTLFDPSYCFSRRFLSPLVDFGLLHSRRVVLDKTPYGVTDLRKAPLFDKFISFHLNPE